jgi:ectoine hydroxylase-related dioxygenase (phytanoyl-CoA dioxygenase family)
MNEIERYLFDLNGYLVLKNVLTPGEVALCNKGIDQHADEVQIRAPEYSLAQDSRTLNGSHGRGELSGFLKWPSPWCEPFRKMLAHPRIVNCLNEILGPGFRVDHGPGLFVTDKGTEGHVLHGSSGPGFDPHQYYIFKNGKMHNGLTVVEWPLADVGPDDGGLCVIPGSHKSNLACPTEIRKWEECRDTVRPIVCEAGDVVIFTEALTHGTLPWRADHDRRAALCKYSPGNMSYGKHYLDSWKESVPDGLTADQQAVFEPPYHVKSRPILEPKN